jgi:tetratricopeptide (TPR) repeat protein
MTTQVRPPGGRSKMHHLSSGILAHMVAALQLLICTIKGGHQMLQRISLFLALLILFSAALVHAQTPASASTYFDHGTMRFRKGDLDGAIEDFTKAIEISSRLGPTKLVRGNSVRGASGFSDSDSIGAASSITVIDPLTANALTSRGLARYEKGDIDGAVADWERAIRINPGLAAAYLDRGCARYAKGDAQGALADWNRAIQINPHLAEAYCNRGGLRQKLGDLEGAFADLDKSIALDRHDARAYCNRGYAWIEKRDFDRAIADFNTASELNPRLAWTFQGRGTARLSKYDLESAIADFDRALALDLNFVDAYVDRGLALLLQSKETEAAKDFERALAIDPSLKEEIDKRIKAVNDLRTTKR